MSVIRLGQLATACTAIIAVLIAVFIYTLDPAGSTRHLLAFAEQDQLFLYDTVAEQSVAVDLTEALSHRTLIDWFPDGKRFAYTLSGEDAVRIHDLRTGRTHMLGDGITRPNDVTLSEDGAYLLYRGRQDEQRVMVRYSLRDGVVEIMDTGFDDDLFRPQWSPDGQRFFGHMGGLLVHTLNSSESIMYTLSEIPAMDIRRCSPNLVAAWMPDSDTLLFSQSKQIYVGSATQHTFEVMNDLRIHFALAEVHALLPKGTNAERVAACIDAIEVSPDARWLALRITKHHLYIFDLINIYDTPMRLTEFTPDTNAEIHIAGWSDDGKHLFALTTADTDAPCAYVVIDPARQRTQTLATIPCNDVDYVRVSMPN